MNDLSITDLIKAGLWACGASAGCAVYFNTRKEDIPFGAVLGALGWILYVIVKALTQSDGKGYIAGAFSVAVLAELYAVLLKRPATVFLVPGIIPLVPGAGIFNMMRMAVQGRLDESVAAGYNTLIAAGAIALGVAMASSLARLAQNIVKGRRDKKLRSIAGSVPYQDSDD